MGRALLRRALSAALTIGIVTVGLIGPTSDPAGATTTDENFVTKVYRDFMLTTPSATQLSAGVTSVTTVGRTSFVRSVIRSADWQSLWVNGAYLNYLDRSPTATELSTGLTSIGSTYNFLAAELDVLASASYYTESGGTNSGFVSAIYLDILQRAPSAGDTTFWTGQLGSGTTPRSMANYVIRTLESANRRVGGTPSMTTCPTLVLSAAALEAGSYCLILDRIADASGQAYWAGRLTSTDQLPDLWVSLAASPEYYTLAQTSYPW